MRKPKGPKTAGKKKSAKPAAEIDSGEIPPDTETEAQADPEAAAALAQDAARPEDLPPATDGDNEEPGQRSFATTALMIMLAIIFIASLTLWAAPILAPYLPAGVAQYLLPGQIDTEGRIAGLDDAVAAGAAKSDAAVAALSAEIAALSGRLDAAAKTRQGDAGQAEIALETARSAAESAAAAAASLAARLDAIEAGLAALRSEFGAISDALANAEDGATAPELAAAVAALGARIDTLSRSVEGGATAEALEAGISALATRLDAVETSAADAREVQSETLGEVSSAIRQARLQAAADLLASRLTGGLPYAAKLNEIAALTGAAPPAPLAAGASTGLATAAALEASYGRHAQAAIAADVQANAGESTGQQVLGWLRAQVSGRPVDEVEGDSVGAVTSRIAARVKEGKLAEALAEAETLPEHARAGLGRWLDQLRARVAADLALAGWRARIGADG